MLLQHRIKLGVALLVSFAFAVSFALLTTKIIAPSPRVSVFLRDMTSSFTFLDDVYLLNIPALKGRLENWVDHINAVTHQPICLSSRFSTFSNTEIDQETSIIVCSSNAKISELARKSDDSGVVPITLGDKKTGEIEWLTETHLDRNLFSIILLFHVLSGAIAYLSFFFLFSKKPEEKKHKSEHENVDIRRSLIRVMGANRRTMAFHDNWIYGERSHPYINFINLDGSKLRIRASLNDISTIFPSSRYINRSSIINTGVGVHKIDKNQITLKIKTGEIKLDIEPNYRSAFINEKMNI